MVRKVKESPLPGLSTSNETDMTTPTLLLLGGIAGGTIFLGLPVVRIVGFGLHNATEGFGIVGPMAGDAELPSWGYLATLGLIGGAPTFLGTIVGRSVVNDALSVAFLALAAGSIIYVVAQL